MDGLGALVAQGGRSGSRPRSPCSCHEVAHRSFATFIAHATSTLEPRSAYTVVTNSTLTIDLAVHVTFRSGAETAILRQTAPPGQTIPTPKATSQMTTILTHPRIRRLTVTIASALLATTIVLVAGPASPVHAAPVATLNTKGVAPTTSTSDPALPGDEFVYTINYSCSGLVADTCAGALITDVLPTFTDIYGNTNQLQLVSGAASTPSDWTFQNDSGPSGFVPNQSVSWVATSNLVAGDSGAVSLTLRVPPGIVPDTAVPQQVDNTATLTFGAQAPDPSDTAISFIDANPPSSSLSKSGPTTATLNAAGTDDITHTITICPSPGSPLWENYTVTDTLPPGVTVVTSPLPFSGVFTPGTPSTSVPGPNPGDPDVVTAGTGGTIVWNLTPINRPTLTAAGCLPISFDVNYVNAAAGGDLANTIGESKTNTVDVVGSNTAGGTQNIGPADTTLTLDGPRTIFSASKNTGGNFYVQDGDTVTYFLGASNTSDTEALGFTDATLTDGPFPSGFVLTQIFTGTWEGADVTASIETSPDGSTWTQVSTAQSVTIAAGAAVQYVRWVFSSPSAAIVRGWDATGQTLTGTINGSTPPSVTRQNCVALEGIQSGIAQRVRAVAPTSSSSHPSRTPTSASRHPAKSLRVKPSPTRSSRRTTAMRPEIWSGCS